MSVDDLALLFSDESISRITACAFQVAADKIFDDDLWNFHSNVIVRRTLVDEIGKREDIKQTFLSTLDEKDRVRMQRFFSFSKKDFKAETEEQLLALRELDQSYGGDLWAWAQEAFKGEQEFAGSDLEGFDPQDISEAIVQLWIEQWEMC